MKREEIDKIRESVSIIDIISRYVNLNKTGKNYKGICPFHEDNDPSLSVDPEKNLWYCFGCGAGGDVFEFLTKIENLSFPEAARKLAKETGIKLSEQNEKSKNNKEKLREIMAEAADYFHRNLLRNGVGQKARSYLAERGYEKEVIKKFKLGYALPGWRSLTNKFSPRFGKKKLKGVGLIKEADDGESHYDRFRDRVMFPIRSPNGKTIAFGGRIIEDSGEGPKYLNSPNTKLFHKGCTLFGLDQARKEIINSDLVVLMEGYTDVIAAQSHGIINSVASLGTSLTEKQAKLLRRFADKAIIAFDSDQAGKKASLKGLRLLRNKGVKVKIAPLPPDSDPADILENEGRTKLKEILVDAKPFHRFFLDTLEEEYDLNSIEGKEDALRWSTKFARDIESPPLRHEIIKELKDLLEVPEDELSKLIEKRNKEISIDRPGIENAQEELTLGEWLLYLLVNDKIKPEELREENVLEGLQENYIKLIEKIESGREEGLSIDGIIDRLESEDLKQILTKVTMKRLPYDEKGINQVSSDTLKKIYNRMIDRRIRNKRRKLKKIEKQGGDPEEKGKLQQKIMDLKKKKLKKSSFDGSS